MCLRRGNSKHSNANGALDPQARAKDRSLEEILEFVPISERALCPLVEVLAYRVDVLRAIGDSGCYAHAIADRLRVAFRHLVEERNGLAIGEHAAGHKTAGRRDDLGCDLALLGWPSFNALGIQPPDDRLTPRLRAEE
jgi:hypothetical protein